MIIMMKKFNFFCFKFCYNEFFIYSCRERQRYIKNEFDGNQELGYLEEEVFDNFVEFGGLVSVFQYVKDNIYLNENFIQWFLKC